jgi:hypothetical protein
MNYRTEINICVGCDTEYKARFRVDPKWAGVFRMAMNARYCYRCSSIFKLAQEGDTECKKFIDKHVVAYI